MARARNIKPGFFTNEDLVELDFATRLLFAGLWTVADREGRLQDRPKKIKIDVFPADNLDIDAMLQALHDANFIQRYEVNGSKFIQISSWSKHQNPHHTEKASEIPGVNGEVTVKEPSKPKDAQLPDGGNLADSLIPDSLIPDSKEKTAPRKRVTTPVTAKPDDIDPQTWADWLNLRKAKRAPVTTTVVDEARRECAKAGMTLENFLRVWCRRGSQGLEAAWLKPDERGHVQQSGETAYQRSMRERMQEAVPEIARKAPNAVQQDATEFFRTIEGATRVIDVQALGVSP